MKLEPCPFCGGSAAFETFNEGKETVRCEDCKASLGYCETTEEAACFWNRRPIEESLADVLNSLLEWDKKYPTCLANMGMKEICEADIELDNVIQDAKALL